MHRTWRTPAALSLCTQEWHHKSILLQLRHYDIRHQSIYFPLQKTKHAFVHLPLYQCCHLFPLFPALAKSLTLTSEENSEQNQKSPSSPNLLQQLPSLDFHHSFTQNHSLGNDLTLSRLNKKLHVKFVKALCGRSFASTCDNSTLCSCVHN